MKGIYKITCSATDIVYIGSTAVSFKKRWKQHKQRLRNNYQENKMRLEKENIIGYLSISRKEKIFALTYQITHLEEIH